MDSQKVHKLKTVLAVISIAYVALQARNQQIEEEYKEKKRQRMQTLKRRFESTRSSSSSSDEENLPQEENSFQKKFKKQFENNKELPVPSKINQEQQIQISHVRSLNYSHSTTSSYGYVDKLVSKFTEIQFKQAFRVSSKTADFLYTRFQSSPEYKNIFKLNNHTRIPEKHYIWMFLWFVGRKFSYMELSQMFNVPLSRSVSAIDTVIQFLNNCARDIIRFPETPSELRTAAESFEEMAGLPEVIGCLVSTHVQGNRHSKPSSVQAFCDSKGRFLDVFFSSINELHPIELLEKSQINEKLKIICRGKYHVLAGKDFFIREWLLTPFDEPTSLKEHCFNRKYSKTMNEVSKIWKDLKKRFEQLENKHFSSSNKLKKLVIACCVLHNICVDGGDWFDTESDPLETVAVLEGTNKEVTQKPVDESTHLRRIGELKRKQIVGELKVQ